MRGETVIVEIREGSSENSFGESVPDVREVTVDNVLVAPMSTEDLGEDRPEGFEARYTLIFPKSFKETLAKTRVKVRGAWYHTHGFSDHFDESVCPTDWNMTVVVGDFDG